MEISDHEAICQLGKHASLRELHLENCESVEENQRQPLLQLPQLASLHVSIYNELILKVKPSSACLAVFRSLVITAAAVVKFINAAGSMTASKLELLIIHSNCMRLFLNTEAMVKLNGVELQSKIVLFSNDGFGPDDCQNRKQLGLAMDQEFDIDDNRGPLARTWEDIKHLFYRFHLHHFLPLDCTIELGYLPLLI